MRILRLHPAVLLLSVLLACGEREEPGPEQVLIDLRPVWTPGDVFEVRLERTVRTGQGDFPATGELESRSSSTESFLDAYTVEVLAGSGTDLVRTIRTYVRSHRTKDGVRSSTPLTGHTYEIEDPFGTHLAERRVEDGEPPAVEEEERKLLKATSLLLAATLIPDQPVPEGASWRPGRDLGGLSAVGTGRVGLGCKLTEIREEDGQRTAEVRGTIRGQIRDDDRPGARMSARETLHVDLTAREIRTYRSVMEIEFPPAPGKRHGSWRWVEAILTVERQ